MSDRRIYPSAEQVARAREALVGHTTSAFVMGYISPSAVRGYLDEDDAAMIVVYCQLREEENR